MPATDSLPRRVRIGYGSGSVATGAFGTVPGLMLLPYLTDSLGIAALAAGFIVFLPKAWDVVLNPVAGRISDRTVDPRGPRRPWLLRAGLLLAAGFAVLFAAPEMATWIEAVISAGRFGSSSMPRTADRASTRVFRTASSMLSTATAYCWSRLRSFQWSGEIRAVSLPATTA